MVHCGGAAAVVRQAFNTGLQEAVWLVDRLCTSSNPELAEKEELFRAQHAVILPKAHLLGDVLAAYLKLKQELQDRGSRQSELVRMTP